MNLVCLWTTIKYTLSMKGLLLLVLISALLLTGFLFVRSRSSSMNGGGLTGILEILRRTKTPTDSALPRAGKGGASPFGVMLAGKSVDVASQLGVSYYRPSSIFIDKWNGNCTECDLVVAQDLKLILTVRNNGGAGQPTSPPADLEAYKRTLKSVLDKYKPEILAVENEENSQTLFYSGSPSQYHQELKAACEVAHSKGIKCTNGGLVSSLVALLVANNYIEKGDNSKAEDFIKLTLRDDQYDKFQKAGGFSSKAIIDQIETGKEFVSGYKNAGADYINFHWYIADTTALGEAVDYLEAASGLNALTNEVGQQRNEDPNQVTSVMQKIVDLKLPYAVWFSMDVPGFGGARSLLNPDGTLRPNGEAFRDFIDKNF